jgi:hypothetical protein
MVTANQTQRINWIAALEDDISHQVEAFLLDRQTRNLAAGTSRFYQQKLSLFIKFSKHHAVSMVSRLHQLSSIHFFTGNDTNWVDFGIAPIEAEVE